MIYNLVRDHLWTTHYPPYYYSGMYFVKITLNLKQNTMARQHTNEVNAGSTADIAFLLLIFFLVTTTMKTDEGINRKLPPEQTDSTSLEIKERNLFKVLINAEGELLVQDKPMDIKNLKQATIAFLDNGAGTDRERCEYCKGAKDALSSVNPVKAVISVQADRLTKYANYITVQNELVAAYTTLRNRESQRLYGISFLEMQENIENESYKGNKAKLKKQMEIIKAMFPQKISEAEPSEAKVN